MSKITVHDEQVLGELRGMQQRLGRTGIDQLGEEIRSTLEANASEAFASKVDPGTGRPWEPAAEATSGSGRFRSLLERSGELKASAKSSLQRGSTGSVFARIGLEASGSILVRGLVHHYGVTARRQRSNRSRRKRSQFTIPKRPFVGLSRQDIARFLARAEAVILGR